MKLNKNKSQFRYLFKIAQVQKAKLGSAEGRVIFLFKYMCRLRVLAACKLTALMCVPKKPK